MEFITNGKKLEARLIELLAKCESCSIAVAWASMRNQFAEELAKNKDKIEFLIVGIHFYQTDPLFMNEFIDHSKFRVVKDLSGVFHPKIYQFDLGDSAVVVIGSSNLTKGGLGLNRECSTLVEIRKNTKSFKELDKNFEEYSNVSERIDKEFLKTYSSMYSRKVRSREKLGGNYSKEYSQDFKKTPLKRDIFTLDWIEYLNRVSNDQNHSVEGRVEILNIARELFMKNRFSAMSETERKMLAGILPQGIDMNDWGWFGSMKGAGEFKKQVIHNNKHFAEALDEIPLSGIVDKENYESYCERFLKAYNRANPLATATRLLAMKRPDYFFCMASKNKTLFCKEFGIKKTTVTIHNYWEEVVDRVTDCNWWNSYEPTKGIARDIWRGRAAFLDVIYYEP